MRTIKILALAVTLLVAMTSLAMAGGPGCTAGSASTVSTAGATGIPACCAAKASAQTASAKLGSAGCSAAAHAKMAQLVELETVRMPSGAMAVFYNGKTDEAVQYLQASATKGVENFSCGLAQSMAADAHCNVEIANTEHGVMLLVKADSKDVVDQYQKQYEVATASVPAEKPSEEQGE